MQKSLLLGVCIFIVAILLLGSYLYFGAQSVGTYFVVDVLGERFNMLVVDPATIQDAMGNMNGLNNMHPIGELEFGDGGFNQPWGWHYKPDTVRMTDFSTEVCDAEPHFVQENLDYFVNVVKYYCPWTAKIVGASQTVPLPNIGPGIFSAAHQGLNVRLLTCFDSWKLLRRDFALVHL